MKISNQDCLKITNDHGAHHYNPLPVAIEGGKGIYLWDVEGNRYVDLLSCYSAQIFGHCFEPLVEAGRNQMGKLCAPSRGAVMSPEQVFWEKEITEFCKIERVLGMNTGAEAVETAIKVARRWGYFSKNIEENTAEIIVCSNNFHGRTTTIISFSDGEAKRGFGPFISGFKNISFGDPWALEEAITKNTVGFLVEPIQGEAGVMIPSVGYLKSVRDICAHNNVLLMLDEIQTGFCRTGKTFCFEHDDIRPDILILGKALGGGIMPISAMLTSQKIMSVFTQGSHGSTFGENPLACRISREVLRQIKKCKQLNEIVEEKGKYFAKKLKSVFDRNGILKEVRQRGLLIGLELTEKSGGARQFCEALLKRGVIAKEVHEYNIRVAPPLIITGREIDFCIEKMQETFQELYA